MLTVEDANDLEAVEAAIRKAQVETGRPTLIIVHSHIGYGSPNKQDKSAAHGEPLGVEEVKATKRFYGWPEDAQFLIPKEVGAHGRGRGAWQEAGSRVESQLRVWAGKNPELAKQWDAIMYGKLPEDWDKDVPVFPPMLKALPPARQAAK